MCDFPHPIAPLLSWIVDILSTFSKNGYVCFRSRNESFYLPLNLDLLQNPFIFLVSVIITMNNANFLIMFLWFNNLKLVVRYIDK